MTRAEKPQLVTLKEFKELSPRAKGYVVYMQAELPGSELHCEQGNPYLEGSREWEQFERGQQDAMLEVQDLDS